MLWQKWRIKIAANLHLIQFISQTNSVSPDFFYITTFFPSNGGYTFKMNINNYHHYGLIISITSIHHEFTDNKDTFVLQRLFVLLSLSLYIYIVVSVNDYATRSILVAFWALLVHARFTLSGCVDCPTCGMRLSLTITCV